MSVTIASQLAAANEAYRSGVPIMTDADYDALIEQLRSIDPNHKYLHKVEEEPEFGEGKVKHPIPMLSTEKAYEKTEVLNWVKKCLKAASELGHKPLEVKFKATAKLDGMAAKFYASTGTLATRGNGLTGNDITSCFRKGVFAPSMDRSTDKVGEIVMDKHYFNGHLSEEFEHPRNVVVGAVSADTLQPAIKSALKAKAIQFVPFDTLAHYTCDAKELISKIDHIYERLTKIAFPIDGIVIEVLGDDIRERMGATSHHNRWQIAKKVRGDVHQCRVTNVTWQVGRTGKVTPVINIEPTRISGAVVSNVTGHHAGNIRANCIGKDAIIEVTRSGEVIPFMTRVIKKAEAAFLPMKCPCCESDLIKDNDFLVCISETCDAKAEARLIHFFKTIEHVDGVGPSVASKLVAAGITWPSQVVSMQVPAELTRIGISSGIARNIITSIHNAKNTMLEDWRLLAAFGIHTLGRGTARRVLEQMTIEQFISMAQLNDIRRIDGIGEISANAIIDGRDRLANEIQSVLDAEWTLEVTSNKEEIESPFSGKTVVFTGTMKISNRSGMEKLAAQLGGKPGKSISKKTDFLVAGEKAGSKLEKAKSLGITILTEEEYLKMAV